MVYFTKTIILWTEGKRFVYYLYTSITNYIFSFTRPATKTIKLFLPDYTYKK